MTTTSLSTTTTATAAATKTTTEGDMQKGNKTSNENLSKTFSKNTNVYGKVKEKDAVSNNPAENTEKK